MRAVLVPDAEVDDRLVEVGLGPVARPGVPDLDPGRPGGDRDRQLNVGAAISSGDVAGEVDGLSPRAAVGRALLRRLRGLRA